MKRVSIFLLSFVMALALARPAFALVDGADLDFNAYNKKVNAGPGAFYPLIKNTFYDGSGNLRQTFGGDYSGDDVSEELPGKTPVEFLCAYDMENGREFLGYCYREDGSEYYDIYARIGGKAKRILHYEHADYVNPFRSSLECVITQSGSKNYIALTSRNNFPADEFDDAYDADADAEMTEAYVFDGNWNLSKTGDIKGEQISENELPFYEDKQMVANCYDLLVGYERMKAQPTEGYEHFFGDASPEAVKEFKLALAPLIAGGKKEGKVDAQFLPGLIAVATYYGNSEEGFAGDADAKSVYGDVAETVKGIEKGDPNSANLELEPYADFYKKYYDAQISHGSEGAEDIFNGPAKISFEADKLHYQVDGFSDAEPVAVHIGEVSAYYDYAIVTVDYVTYNRFLGTDAAAGNYCRRNVLVKKERGEDGIRFIPLYINREGYTMERAQEIMGYDFKPVYTSGIDFQILKEMGPDDWLDLLKIKLEVAGYTSGQLVDVDQWRVANFVAECKAMPKKQMLKKRSFVVDGKAVAAMEDDRELPEDFQAYLQELGIQMKDSYGKAALYIDCSKSRGRGVEFYIKNLDPNTFPDYLVIKKGKKFTWVIPKASLFNGAYYYLNREGDELELEVAIGGKKSEYVPLSFLFLGDKVKAMTKGGTHLKPGRSIDGDVAFVPAKAGLYTLSKEEVDDGQSGYALMMNRALESYSLGENGLNRLALAKVLSYTPLSAPLVDVGEIKDGGNQANLVKGLVARGVYGLDQGNVYPNAVVGGEDAKRIAEPAALKFGAEEADFLEQFRKEGGRTNFLNEFESMAVECAAMAAKDVEKGDQAVFLDSTAPDDEALDAYHSLVGVTGFSLLADMMHFPGILWLILILLILCYILLAHFGKLPARYNLFLPETRLQLKEKLRSGLEAKKEGMHRSAEKRRESKEAKRKEKDASENEAVDDESTAEEETANEAYIDALIAEAEMKEAAKMAEEEKARKEAEEKARKEAEEKGRKEAEEAALIEEGKGEEQSEPDATDEADKFCPRCGSKREAGALFCGKCGRRFN